MSPRRCQTHPSSPVTDAGCVLCEGQRLAELDRASPRIGLRRPKAAPPPNETPSRLRFKRSGGLVASSGFKLGTAKPTRERLADGTADFGAAVDPWFYELYERAH